MEHGNKWFGPALGYSEDLSSWFPTRPHHQVNFTLRRGLVLRVLLTKLSIGLHDRGQLAIDYWVGQRDLHRMAL